MKYLSLFSGIGSPEQALKNLGVEFELFGFSEINKYAIKSYCAVHGVDESLNLGDITKIDIESLPLDIDLITHGSPCQDFSVAGSGKGGDSGSGTRSSLMWNTVAICEHCKPKYVIWENVKNVLSKKHRHNFDKYLEEMERIGYNNFYQVLNAKDYGIPQNRERIFVISTRKDIEKDFKFPKGFDNGIRLKDILEDFVDEKYYLSPEIQNKISNWKAYQRPFENVLGENSITPTLTARGAGEYHSGMVLVGEGLKEKTNLENDKIICEQRSDEGLRFFKDNICGTLRTIDACGDKRVIENGAIRGRYNEEGKIQQQLELRNDGVINTLTTVEKDNVIVKNVSFNDKSEIRIRKLTPLECWRLMGFKDEQFLKAEQVCSNSQLYKQAGNSIVVNVMEEIFKNLI